MIFEPDNHKKLVTAYIKMKKGYCVRAMKLVFIKNITKWLREKGYKVFLLFVLILACGTIGYRYKNNAKGENTTLPHYDNDMEFRKEITSLEKPDVNINLYAKAAVLLDGENGRVLYEKSGYEVMPMASTTKIMTCLLALEYGEEHPLDKEWVTVSAYAAAQPKVKAGLRAGEQYLLSDLLYSMMLESHNDTAVAVAEHIGRRLSGAELAKNKEESKSYVKVFTDAMDQKAKELGCKHTNFVTPNGLDAEDEDGIHATNAVELGRIAAYAMHNDAFCKIIQTSNHAFSDQKIVHTIHAYNKDAYLTMEDGACGVKTGFTNEAGYCFVGAKRCEGNLFISVVLGCGWPPEKSKKWSDTRKIMDLAKTNYDKKEIIYHPFEQYIRVNDGVKDYCKVSAKPKEAEELLLAPWEKITMFQYQKGTLHAPVKEGEVVGYQIYRIDEEFWKKIPICAQESINVITIVHCIEKVTKMWLL